jgi:Fe2+ or Zn2+ uptake regulation protein
MDRSTGLELHDVVSERLGRDGQRYTANRRVLVTELARSEHPLRIRELIDQRPGLAQSSVYRNLVVLESAGVVSKLVTTGESASYELAEDLTGHHHHLICARCGTVRDIEVGAHVESVLADSAQRLAGALGFTVDHHRLDLVGTCSDCMSIEKP